MIGRPAIFDQTLIEKFLALIEDGTNKRAAARALGVSVNTIRCVAKRYGIQLPMRNPADLAVKRIKDFEPQILAKTISQHEIARRLGVSQAHISRLYRKFRYPCLPVGQPPVQLEG